jgi:hypothetical protein
LFVVKFVNKIAATAQNSGDEKQNRECFNKHGAS